MRYSHEKIRGADLPQPDPEHILEIGRDIRINRRILDELLVRQNMDLVVIKGMLSRLNPENAEKFLDGILAIDPEAADDVKAKALFDMLKGHSKNTVLHCKDTERILEEIKNNPAFKKMDLGALAKAIEHHDFGKFGMRASTLNEKHERFTAHQNAEKEGHSYLGFLILKALNFDALSGRLALTHHLKYQTKNGRPEIVGYPKADFLAYCQQNGLEPELTPEDQIASFVDVYSALIDMRRPSDPYGMKKISHLSEAERAEFALEKMDNEIFKDEYYQRGAGAALYHAFKEAIWKADIQTQPRLAA
jgi:response regulator RpfG family c-di-GMP phosphodiesterase